MRYISLLAIIAMTGCMTSSSMVRPKSLNTSNLEKTNYGTYRLVSKSIQESGVKPGLTYKEPDRVKEMDSPNIGSEAVLSPKLREQKKDFSKEPKLPLLNIATEEAAKKTEEEAKPMMKVNWWGLALFYILAGWAIYIMWLCWKTAKNYREKLENPFQKKKEDESDNQLTLDL